MIEADLILRGARLPTLEPLKDERPRVGPAAGDVGAVNDGFVAARDGTTNALALRDAGDFAPLYGAGSAARFAQHLGAARLALPGMRDDVDTWEDLERVRDRLGKNTRRYLSRLVRM